MYCGCPIHWVSKLQSKIALSTTEAEYIALSMCLRDLLPMRTMLAELCKGFNFGVPASSVLGTTSRIDTRMHQATIYEDNTIRLGAQSLFSVRKHSSAWLVSQSLN